MLVNHAHERALIKNKETACHANRNKVWETIKIHGLETEKATKLHYEARQTLPFGK